MACRRTSDVPTSLQLLATYTLGSDVIAWVQALNDGTRSYGAIATDLANATDGAIDVSDETIRRWCMA